MWLQKLYKHSMSDKTEYDGDLKSSILDQLALRNIVDAIPNRMENGTLHKRTAPCLYV